MKKYLCEIPIPGIMWEHSIIVNGALYLAVPFPEGQELPWRIKVFKIDADPAQYIAYEGRRYYLSPKGQACPVKERAADYRAPISRIGS